jgi:hypothetical protein
MVRFTVKGDKFSGYLTVTYNSGTDLYDVEFLSKKGDNIKKEYGIYGDQLAQILWNETFIV